MKKVLSIVLVAILLFAGLFILTGCGNDSNDSGNAKNESLSAYAGTYKGEYTKFVGDKDSAKNDKAVFSLELNADGTGTNKRDGEEYKVTWSVEGENFKMSETFMGMSIDYTGTLKNGKLDIFNGDPKNDLTCEYVYSK